MDKLKYASALYMIRESLSAWKHQRAQITDGMQVGYKPAINELAKIDASIRVYEYVLSILPKENE